MPTKSIQQMKEEEGWFYQAARLNYEHAVWFERYVENLRLLPEFYKQVRENILEANRLLHDVSQSLLAAIEIGKAEQEAVIKDKTKES